MNLGSVRDYDEFIRRLAVTVVILIAYRFGAQLPLPGITPEALAQASGITPAHLSIFALGILPFFGIVVLFEFLKVLAPRLRQWELRDQRNRAWLNRLIVIVSLVAAAAQSSGLVLAMENIPGLVISPGTAFHFTGILSLVAGTALVMWLADMITRHGLGSGMWLILAAAWLGDLPGTLMRAFARAPFALAATELIVGCIILVVLLGALIAVIRAGDDNAANARTLLWTHLIADTTWPWLILTLSLVTGMSLYWTSPTNPLALCFLAILLFLFAHLYKRSCQRAGTDASPLPTFVLGGILTVLGVGIWLLPLAHVAPIAAHLVLLTVVSVTILERWWIPPFPVRSEATRSDED